MSSHDRAEDEQQHNQHDRHSDLQLALLEEDGFYFLDLAIPWTTIVSAEVSGKPRRP